MEGANVYDYNEKKTDVTKLFYRT